MIPHYGTSVWLIACLAVCIAASSGCTTSYALMQTAHTQPALKTRVKLAVANIHNALDGNADRNVFNMSTQEPGVRMGVNDFLDVGIAAFMGLGASLDAKANLLDNRRRAAIAPRLLLGYAYAIERDVFSAEAGLVGSYRLEDWLEPYAGLSFGNYWFSGVNRDPTQDLPPNKHFASRRGYGDGMIKTAIGVQLRLANAVHALFEYGHWFTAQNDPGDGYALLANDNIAVALAFGTH